MRVLVTGARGFTGHYVMAALKNKGHDPVGLDADMTDPAAVDAGVSAIAPSAVLHLAAKAFVHSDDFASMYAVNQVGTFNLLKSVASYSANTQVVLASSANIYGATESAALTEDTLPNPLSHYALSKWAMELGAKFWMDRLAITIVRPFNYTGVGQEPIYLIPKIVDHLRRGAPEISMGNLNSARDIGDVRDVAEVYGELVGQQTAGRVFNICTGRGVTAQQALDIACRLKDYTPAINVDPRFLRSNEIPYLVGDNTRLREVLPNWQPRALEETIEWMLNSAPHERT